MRTTLNIDDDLLKKAQEITGITEKTKLVNQALQEIIAREAGRRLMLLGGTMPDFEAAPRRRPWNE